MKTPDKVELSWCSKSVNKEIEVMLTFGAEGRVCCYSEMTFQKAPVKFENLFPLF